MWSALLSKVKGKSKSSGGDKKGEKEDEDEKKVDSSEHYCREEVPTVTLDLSVAPEHRWDEVCAQFGSEMTAIFRTSRATTGLPRSR